MKEENTRELFNLLTERMLNERREEFREDDTNWRTIADILVQAAEETCGRKNREIANPSLDRRSREGTGLPQLRARSVDRQKKHYSRNNKNKTRETSKRGRNKQSKRKIKAARRNMKNRQRQMEREWWNEKIEECKEANRRGDMGKTYQILRELGQRERKAAEGSKVTTEEFKEHFLEISIHRYERSPQEIEETTRWFKTSGPHRRQKKPITY